MTTRRINLLPVELAQARRLRQRTLSLVAAGAALVGLLAVVYVFEQVRLSSARHDLDSAKAKTAALQVQVSQLADYDRIERDLKEKGALVDDLTKAEVRWSVLLADTAMVIPQEVWLTNFTANVNASSVGAKAVTTGDVVLGTIQLTGVTFTHLDVAKWLTRLGAVDGFTFPYLTLSSKGTIGLTPVVTFNSSVQLSDKAFRRNQPGGERTT